MMSGQAASRSNGYGAPFMAAAPRSEAAPFTRSEVAAFYHYRVPEMRQIMNGQWRGKCPIHNGKDLNFAVDGATGRAYCHSQCARGWDIISLEQELSGVDFKAALAEVRRIVGRPEQGIPKAPPTGTGKNAAGHRAQADERRRVDANKGSGSDRAPDTAASRVLASVVREDLKRDGWVYHSHGDFGGALRQVRFEHTQKLQRDKGRPEKTFRWEHCVGEEWFSGSGNQPIPLFANQVALNSGTPIETLLLCEGWTKCNAADQFEIPAVSLKELNEANVDSLPACQCVVLWPDNDSAGAKAAKNAATVISKRHPNVFVIDPPSELPKGGDIIDAIAAGWDGEQIRALIDSARRVSPESGDFPTGEGQTSTVEGRSDEILNVWDLPAVGASTPEIEYIAEPIIVKGTVTGISGPPGGGKSTIVTALVRDAIRAGVPALVLDRENPRSVVFERMSRLGLEDSSLLRWWGGWLGDVPI